MDEYIVIEESFFNSIMIALFFCLLVVFVFVKLFQLCRDIIIGRSESGGGDDRNNSLELREVVVAVDEQTAMEVSKNCTECAICLEKLGAENNDEYEEDDDEKEELILKQCGHKFHGSCMLRWLCYGNRTCPTCRRPCSRPSRNPLSHNLCVMSVSPLDIC